MNEPPVLTELPVRPATPIWVWVALALSAFVATAAVAFSFLTAMQLRETQRQLFAATQTSARVQSELESARRDLAANLAPPADGEIGRTFAGVRQVTDHYEGLGYVTLARFERSQWPAKVVHQKLSTNEISFQLKKSGRHSYPGHDGYRLKAVTLEDSAGGETVVVFRSVQKLARPTTVIDSAPSP